MSDTLDPSPPSPRQTQNFLRGLFAEHGLDPKSKLGQNFLIDLNLLDVLVRSAELSREDAVLEVGSGTGSLTNRLASEAGAVVSVEIDSDFAPIVRRLVGNRPNTRLIHGDILRRKSEINPDVRAALAEDQARFGCTRWKLVANLPYVVATPVIANLLTDPDPPERMVVTVQWEIGERLTAAVGSKEYNALSVLVQSVAEVEILRKLPPTVFWPKPKVDSAIVRIRPNAEKRAQIADLKSFREFLRDLYTHRRKTLRQALTGWPQGRRSKTEVDAMLERLGIASNERSEVLDLEQHRRLWQAFMQLRPE